MEGFARGFAETFEERFAKNQESIESLEPEALKQRELAKLIGVLRYLLLYCTAVRFPKYVSLALEQAQRLDTPEQLRAMLDKLLAANTDQEARYALIMRDILRSTSFSQKTIKEGSEEGEKRGLEEALLQIVEIRFPPLLAQAKQVIEQKTPAEQLQTLFNTLLQANTLEEAQTALVPNG
jgi:hypothetical protein